MKKISLSLATLFINALLFAQEKATNVNVELNKDSNGSNWYASPWVWIVGAAVFIILLVALSSGGRSSSSRGEKVTVTKTVRRDEV
jgi:hypothetical protein